MKSLLSPKQPLSKLKNVMLMGMLLGPFALGAVNLIFDFYESIEILKGQSLLSTIGILIILIIQSVAIISVWILVVGWPLLSLEKFIDLKDKSLFLLSILITLLLTGLIFIIVNSLIADNFVNENIALKSFVVTGFFFSVIGGYALFMQRS